jgi:phosphoribosylformylglycinamidine cyclo-ligase
LRDIIRSGAAVLSGSAIGRTPRLDWFDPSRIRNGDAIVFCESSGVHANGLTKAREISEKLLHGYQTTVPSLVNETYGEILLHPTHIYTPVVRVCYENSIDIHYAVNVTGHGWRKLMRPHQPFRYVVNSVPFRSPVFDFIQEHGGLTDEEMYASYNMGAGFALYMPKTSAQRLIEEAKQNLWPFRIFEAGHVEIAKKKHVVIESEGIVFQADSLRVR